ncbi:hypothetical protein Mal35_20910 [Gimesia maris]|uniref:hypothetical protein n=1 Tax=Gimesia maris TaxID=122 RepID=UPI00118B1D46|nr:hypothetical protein [Gimesia maris]QDT78642.1 hypothetical protein Mal35_20910 [Gimesia maris]
MNQIDPEKKEEKPEESNSGNFWRNLALLMLIFGVPKLWSDSLQENRKPINSIWYPPRPGFNSAPKLDVAKQVKQEVAKSSEAYWNSNVVPLHTYRFRKHESDEPYNEYFLKFLRGYKETVGQTSLTSNSMAVGTASSRPPDPELVKMVKQQLELDKQCLAFLDDLMTKISGKTVLNKSAPTSQELEESATAMENLDLSKLNEEQIEFLNLYNELNDRQLEQFHEIEIMQAVMRERYPGTKFNLPDLERSP